MPAAAAPPNALGGGEGDILWSQASVFFWVPLSCQSGVDRLQAIFRTNFAVIAVGTEAGWMHFFHAVGAALPLVPLLAAPPPALVALRHHLVRGDGPVLFRMPERSQHRILSSQACLLRGYRPRADRAATAIAPGSVVQHGFPAVSTVTADPGGEVLGIGQQLIQALVVFLAVPFHKEMRIEHSGVVFLCWKLARTVRAPGVLLGSVCHCRSIFPMTFRTIPDCFQGRAGHDSVRGTLILFTPLLCQIRKENGERTLFPLVVIGLLDLDVVSNEIRRVPVNHLADQRLQPVEYVADELIHIGMRGGVVIGEHVPLPDIFCQG